MARNDSPSKGKKTRTPARTVKPKIGDASGPPSSTDVAIGQQERHQMIAEAAYYRAQQRGFSGGDPLRDWLEAEAEVRMRLGDGMTRANDGIHFGTGGDTVAFEATRGL